MKKWFLPVVWYSFLFFEKSSQRIITFWSVLVPVCKSGHILKGFKDNMMHWESRILFSLNEIKLILKPAEKKFG